MNKREIRELATRLNTTPHVVATVLQVAGHVLRERYRKRGWEPKKREKPPKGFRGQNPPGSGRVDVTDVLASFDSETITDVGADGKPFMVNGKRLTRVEWEALWTDAWDAVGGRPMPHPDGPFAQPPDVPAIPEFDQKGIRP